MSIAPKEFLTYINGALNEMELTRDVMLGQGPAS